MKISMHIQPSQFEFIGFEYEPIEGLPDSVIELAISDFMRSKGLLKGGAGLEQKEIDSLIEKMMLGVTIEGGTELYAKATKEQQVEIQRVKRALQRIKAKQK